MFRTEVRIRKVISNALFDKDTYANLENYVFEILIKAHKFKHYGVEATKSQLIDLIKDYDWNFNEGFINNTPSTGKHDLKVLIIEKTRLLTYELDDLRSKKISIITTGASIIIAIVAVVQTQINIKDSKLSYVALSTQFTQLLTKNAELEKRFGDLSVKLESISATQKSKSK